MARSQKRSVFVEKEISYIYMEYGEFMFDGAVKKEKCLWWKEIWSGEYCIHLFLSLYISFADPQLILFLSKEKTGKLLTLWASTVWICVSYEIINFLWLSCLKKLNYYASLHWCCTTSQNFDSGSPCRQPDASRPLRFKPCDQQKSSGHSFHYKYRVVLTRPPRFPYQKKTCSSFLTWRISWTRSSSCFFTVVRDIGCAN